MKGKHKRNERREKSALPLATAMNLKSRSNIFAHALSLSLHARILFIINNTKLTYSIQGLNTKSQTNQPHFTDCILPDLV